MITWSLNSIPALRGPWKCNQWTEIPSKRSKSPFICKQRWGKKPLLFLYRSGYFGLDFGLEMAKTSMNFLWMALNKFTLKVESKSCSFMAIYLVRIKSMAYNKHNSTCGAKGLWTVLLLGKKKHEHWGAFLPNSWVIFFSVVESCCHLVGMS